MTSLRTRVLVPLLTVLALVASACGGSSLPDDPAQALVAAMTTTMDEEFAYTFSVDIDEALLADMGGEDAGPFGPEAIINAVKVGGTHVGEDTAFYIEFFNEPVFEIRTFRGSETQGDFFIQLGIATVAEALGAPMDMGDLGQITEMPGMPEIFGQVLQSLLAGDWVGAVDVDSEQIQAAAEEMGADMEGQQQLDAVMEELRSTFSDAQTFLDNYAEVVDEGEDTDGGRVLSVNLEARKLLDEVTAALAPVLAEQTGEEFDEAERQDMVEQTPETLAGFTVTVADGHVTRVSLDVGEMLAGIEAAADAAAQVGPGQAVLTVEFEYENVDSIERPDAAVTLSTDDIIALLEAASEFGANAGALGGLPGGDSLGDPEALRADIESLAAAEEAYFTANGTYTDDLAALEAAGFVGDPSNQYGACTYEDGSAYVVAGAGMAGILLLDSASGEVTEDFSSVGCFPEY